MIAWFSDWHNQTTMVLGLCSLFFCLGWVKPRFGTPAAALLLFCCASAIYVWAFKDNRYLSVDVYNQMALRYFAADSLAKILLICVPLMLLTDARETSMLFGEFACSAFVLLSSLVALIQSRHGCGENNCGGLIGNPSISMGAMVCMLPVFIRSWNRQWLVMGVAAAAVLISQSSIAVGLLAAYACLWLFPWKTFEFRRMAWASVTTAGIFGIAHIALGKDLGNDSDRFMVWKHMIYHWSAPGNLLFGTGLGSYHVFSIILQHIPGQAVVSPGSWWNSMHNDWLECLFWGGGVGVLLLFCTYLAALIKLYKEADWHPLMSAVLFGLYMFLDPALRSPIPMLFGAWLFTYALRKTETKLI